MPMSITRALQTYLKQHQHDQQYYWYGQPRKQNKQKQWLSVCSKWARLFPGKDYHFNPKHNVWTCSESPSLHSGLEIKSTQNSRSSSVPWQINGVNFIMSTTTPCVLSQSWYGTKTLVERSAFRKCSTRTCCFGTRSCKKKLHKNLSYWPGLG